MNFLSVEIENKLLNILFVFYNGTTQFETNQIILTDKLKSSMKGFHHSKEKKNEIRCKNKVKIRNPHAMKRVIKLHNMFQ